MTTHSSILAWRIPWTEEPGGLQSMGWAKSQTQVKQLSVRAHTHTQACKQKNSNAHFGQPNIFFFRLFSLMWSESESCSVVSDSLWPQGLYSPWNSPGQNTGVSSLSLLQGIFPTQGANPGLPHCRQILYQLSHKGSLFSLIDYYKMLSVVP